MFAIERQGLRTIFVITPAAVKFRADKIGIHGINGINGKCFDEIGGSRHSGT